MGTASRRIKGAAALSITALATAIGVSAATDTLKGNAEFKDNAPDNITATYTGKTFLKKKPGTFATDTGDVTFEDVGAKIKVTMHDHSGTHIEKFTIDDMTDGYFDNVSYSDATFKVDTSGPVLTVYFHIDLITGHMSVSVTDM